jgi:hypothetical protein
VRAITFTIFSSFELLLIEGPHNFGTNRESFHVVRAWTCGRTILIYIVQGQVMRELKVPAGVSPGFCGDNRTIWQKSSFE